MTMGVADLDRLLRGQLKSYELPRRWAKPELATPLAALWKRCAADKVEFGGCLILRNGEVLVPSEHLATGNVDWVSPVAECTPKANAPEHQNVYLGFVHTHPWVADAPYPGFSAIDFWQSVNDGDHLALVCNGLQIFALVRTADLTMPPQRVADEDLERWAAIYQTLVEPQGQLLKGQAFDSALWDANLILCEKTGYAMYVCDDWHSACRFVLHWRPTG